jgi:hypothetical protein
VCVELIVEHVLRFDSVELEVIRTSDDAVYLRLLDPPDDLMSCHGEILAQGAESG